MDKSEKEKLLLKLREKMERDESLPLKKGATRLVFGVGKVDSAILFIGEGPGYWEDQKGEPFVGNAGKLLDSLLQSIKLTRQDVYVTNVVHHRPPENRDPLPEEINSYAVYLDEIIKIINPRVIITLGRFSMGKFLPYERISSVHGKAKEINWSGKSLLVIPMYHPAAALRNPDVLRQEKEDFLKVPAIIENLNNKVDKKVNAEQMGLI